LISNKRKSSNWTETEDDLIRSWVKIHGVKRWNECAKQMNISKNSKQIRDRWIENLSPENRSDNFTFIEEFMIVLLFLSIGSRWSQMKGLLNGRTDKDIKNQFNKLYRKQCKLEKNNDYFNMSNSSNDLKYNESLVVGLYHKYTDLLKNENEKEYIQTIENVNLYISNLNPGFSQILNKSLNRSHTQSSKSSNSSQISQNNYSSCSIISTLSNYSIDGNNSKINNLLQSLDEIESHINIAKSLLKTCSFPYDNIKSDISSLMIALKEVTANV